MSGVTKLLKQKEKVTRVSPTDFSSFSFFSFSYTPVNNEVDDLREFSFPHVFKLHIEKAKSYLYIPLVFYNPAALEILKRLKSLSELQYGWDGGYAVSVQPKVIQNICQSVFAAPSDDIWKDWILFPDTNGTITMMRRDKKASVRVSNDEYSFGSKKKKKLKKDHEPYDPQKFINDLKGINE